MFKSARWIGSPIPTQNNNLYRFKRTVKIEDTKNITADIFADSRYKLYINGRYVCEGPCIGTLNYYDTIELGEYLTEGENTIEATVLYLGASVGASCINRKYRVAFEFEMYRDDESILATDDSWECAIDNSYTFFLGKVHANGYLNERYDKKELEWLKAEVLPYEKGRKNWGVLPHYNLFPRPIKMYQPFNNMPMSISKADMDTRLKKGEKGFIIYELSRHKVGYPEFEFVGNADVTITYGESYVYEKETFGASDGSDHLEDKSIYCKKVRTDKNGEILGAYDELCLRGDKFVFRPFLTKAARYIKVEVSAITDFEITKAEFMEFRYPFEIKNNFKCSDEVYNKIFEVSINTLENCTFDTYVDCPYYEMQQYTEDAYLEMMYTLMLTNDYAMPKKLIYDLWHSQNYEGMQLASAPMEYSQITPPFCLFWIMMLEKYILYTGDRETVKPMMSGVYSILSWFGNYVNEDGVVGVYKYGKFIDWVDDWKNGFMVDDSDEKATAVSSMMYLYALKAGARLFEKFDKKGIAEDLLNEAENLKTSVNKVFYDKEEGLYRDTLGGGFSEHPQFWAVISGAAEGDAARTLLKRCEEDKRVRRCSYSYRFFKNRAYDVCGLKFDIDAFLSDWREMLELEATTWFEFPGDARSDCHAWSSVPIYEFSTKILGVEPIAEGYSKILVNPCFEKLESASGTLPTPHGDICVKWQKADNSYIYEISVPDGIEINTGFDSEAWETVSGDKTTFVFDIV